LAFLTLGISGHIDERDVGEFGFQLRHVVQIDPGLGLGIGVQLGTPGP
jgi:hypothetical protein